MEIYFPSCQLKLLGVALRVMLQFRRQDGVYDHTASSKRPGQWSSQSLGKVADKMVSGLDLETQPNPPNSPVW